MLRKIILIYILLPTLIYGQTIQDPNQGLGGILQNQFEKQLPQLNPLPTPKPEEKRITPEKPSASDITLLVKGFRFEGVSQLSVEELQQVVQPWVNKTVNLNELNKAADAIAQYYQTKKKLAQALIPPQQIGSDGIVLIKIIEARLGAVRVEIEGELNKFEKEKVAQYIYYQNPQGSFVDTEKIEHAIYLLNEIPGLAIETQIEPGDKDGDVSLRVKAADAKWGNGGLTLSNFGSASTGSLQALANLSVNSPLGVGDQIGFNVFKSEGTIYNQASYSFPLHPNGLRLGISGSSMTYSTIGSYAGSKGDASTIGANFSYPLLRSQIANANIAFGFDSKTYLNKLTSGITNSSYLIDVINLGFSGNLYDSLIGGGVTTLSLTASRGEFKSKTWDPSSNVNYGQYTGRIFNKLNLGITRNQQIIPNQSVLNVSFSGQLASTNLDSVERFYLGGPNGVRAYPQSQGGGDQGFLLNLELQQQLPKQVIGYVFYDLGVINQYRNAQVYDLMGAANYNAKNIYSLSGYGIGAKYNIKDLNFNAFVAFPIGSNPLYRFSNRTYVQENNDGYRNVPYFWIQASYRF